MVTKCIAMIKSMNMIIVLNEYMYNSIEKRKVLCCRKSMNSDIV